MIKGYLQDHSGTITTSATSQSLIAASGVNGRSYFLFQNQGAAAMWINFQPGPNVAVPAAVEGQPSIEIAAGATLIFDHGVPQGGASVIGTTTQAFVCKTIGG